jgi:hypothetical protein
MSPILKADLLGGIGTTDIVPTRKRDMTRAEAAQYITDRWFPCSPKTLAKLAVVGGGPAFRKVGRVPLYSETSSDTWAEGKIGPLVRSTAELSASEATPRRRGRPHNQHPSVNSTGEVRR